MFGVKADDDLVADHDGGRGAAVVFSHQLLHVLWVAADVAVLVLDSSLREVGLQRPARRSAGLGVNHHVLFGHAAPR